METFQTMRHATAAAALTKPMAAPYNASTCADITMEAPIE
jgi:hypothetical protein